MYTYFAAFELVLLIIIFFTSSILYSSIELTYRSTAI